MKEDKIKEIEQKIKESCNTIESLYSQIEKMYDFANTIYNRLEKGNKIYVFGNGGSAADAQHIAGELVGRFKKERKALSAIALTTDTSILTAVGNDYDFSDIFARQVEAHTKPGDLLWGISTSGNSENVIKGFEKGKKIGTYNLSFTGNDGGKIKTLSDLNLNVPSSNTPRIQEAHELAYHIICELVENYIVGEK